ncbi:predicted protein [Postia placenta Mad-698-R]|uniref:Uncharacterized protein n=1 Tax=Postia placenta MAD-698-R-SB12 TaxID=670580 RepID=A0A1X6NFI8_9APHY|nr:hypothetical protein POSPLADRAFT_1128149 [Postia placenta MAD-698-R-SB12]EED79123.1 predicted protein [Postia placenta Mad-698-R]OSX67262.1 hypothetical protein POSPLADRAFT_1128149 [Postia placenta MAD-698-R-SB12]
MDRLQYYWYQALRGDEQSQTQQESRLYDEYFERYPCSQFEVLRATRGAKSMLTGLQIALIPGRSTRSNDPIHSSSRLEILSVVTGIVTERTVELHQVTLVNATELLKCAIKKLQEEMAGMSLTSSYESSQLRENEARLASCCADIRVYLNEECPVNRCPLKILGSIFVLSLTSSPGRIGLEEPKSYWPPVTDKVAASIGLMQVYGTPYEIEAVDSKPSFYSVVGTCPSMSLWRDTHLVP